MTVRGRGSAEEAVVVVKPEACEGAVTHPRAKPLASVARNATEAKGGTCSRVLHFIMYYHPETSHTGTGTLGQDVDIGRVRAPVRVGERVMQRKVK